MDYGLGVMRGYLNPHLTDEKLLISTLKFWGKDLELFVKVLNLQSWLNTKQSDEFIQLVILYYD